MPGPLDALRAWDPKAGAHRMVSPEELRDGFLKGNLQLATDGSYPMSLGEDVHLVPAKDVQEALAHGANFATHREVEFARARNDDSSGYKAFADGAANQALMGFGDKARIAMGADPDALAARAAARPTLRAIGGVTGAVSGTLALGALGAAGGLAGLAERGAAATLGEAAASRLGQVAVGAAGQAAEGTVRGVGDAVSEAALGRTDVTAGALLAHAGMGFMFGAGVGGVFGGISGLRVRGSDAEALAAGAGAPEGTAARWLNNARAAAARRGGADEEFVAGAFNPDAAARKAFMEAATEPALGGAERQAANVERRAAEGEVKVAREHRAALATTFPNLSDYHAALPLAEKAVADAEARLAALTEEGRNIPKEAMKRQLAKEGGGGRMGGFEGPLMGEIAGAAMGHPLLGGAVGIGIRAGYQATVQPGRQALQLMRAGRAMDAVRNYVADGVGAVIDGTPEAMKLAGRALPRLIATATTATLTAESSDSRREAYATRIGELADLASNPHLLADRVARGTEDLAVHAPDAAAAMGAQAVSAVQLLLAIAPKPLVQPNPLMPTSAARYVSDSDARTFAEIDAAVQDPLRIVQQLGEGRIPNPQAVRAVQQVHTAFWGIVQEEAARRLATSTSLGHVARMQLSLTFGLTAHPSLDARNLMVQQGIATAVAAQPAARGRGKAIAPPTARDVLKRAETFGMPKTDRLLEK